MSLILQDVGYSYAGTAQGPPVPALRAVTLRVGSQESLAILGPSGAGRTTLLLHLNGLLKPTSGRVLLDDADINARGTNLVTVRRQIGLLMQNPDDQLFGITIRDDVAFGPRQQGLSRAVIDQRVEEALRNVGMPLAQWGDVSPFALSGGQRRRVAIAGILAMHPRVLALDDPLAGLDPLGRTDLCATLRQVQRAYTLSLIVATKDVLSALLVADRFVVLEQGQVTLDTDRAGILAAMPRLAALGLELPAHERVVLSLRERGWALPEVFDDADAAIAAIAAAYGARRKAGV